jgi:hypothetical protein
MRFEQMYDRACLLRTASLERTCDIRFFGRAEGYGHGRNLNAARVILWICFRFRGCTWCSRWGERRSR